MMRGDAGAVAPIHDDGLVALQHREPTILASELGQFLEHRVDRGKRTS